MSAGAETKIPTAAELVVAIEVRDKLRAVHQEAIHERAEAAMVRRSKHEGLAQLARVPTHADEHAAAAERMQAMSRWCQMRQWTVQPWGAEPMSGMIQSLPLYVLAPRKSGLLQAFRYLSEDDLRVCLPTGAEPERRVGTCMTPAEQRGRFLAPPLLHSPGVLACLRPFEGWQLMMRKEDEPNYAAIKERIRFKKAKGKHRKADREQVIALFPEFVENSANHGTYLTDFHDWAVAQLKIRPLSKHHRVAINARIMASYPKWFLLEEGPVAINGLVTRRF